MSDKTAVTVAQETFLHRLSRLQAANDGSRLVATSLDEPGQVKERHPADSRPGHPFEEIIYDNDTRRQFRPGGYILETRRNGMQIYGRPDHSMVIIQNSETRDVQPSHPEKGVTSTKVDDDGLVRFEYEDGTKESHYASGKMDVNHPNGSFEEYDEHGQLLGRWQK